MQYAPLSDLADLNPPVDTSSLDPDTPVTFLGMADVSEEGDILQRHRRPYREVQYGYTPFQEDDVLVAKITPCLENGKGCHATNLTSGVGFGSTEFHVLRAKSGVSPRYLYYWTQFADFRIAAEASMIGSAGQQRVQPYLYDELKVPAFDLDEQRRIARVLDAVDAAIRRTDRVVDKLDHVRQGLLHDVLTCGLTADGALRDPDAHPEQFRDSPLGRIPKEWEILEGEKCFTLHSGRKPRRLRSDAGGEYLYLKVDDFNHPANRKGFVRAQNTFDAKSSDSADVFQPGAVIFPKRGEAIFQNRARVLKQPGTVDPNLMVMENREEVIHHAFLRYELVHIGLHRICDNSGVPQLNNKHLYPMPVAVPAIEEQERIVERLRSAETKASKEYMRKTKIQNLQYGLMRDLRTGAVRITEDVERRVAEVTGRSAATAAS